MAMFYSAYLVSSWSICVLMISVSVITIFLLFLLWVFLTFALVQQSVALLIEALYKGCLSPPRLIKFIMKGDMTVLKYADKRIHFPIGETFQKSCLESVYSVVLSCSHKKVTEIVLSRIKRTERDFKNQAFSWLPHSGIIMPWKGYECQTVWLWKVTEMVRHRCIIIVFAIHSHHSSLWKPLCRAAVTSAWLPHELWMIPQGKHWAQKLLGPMAVYVWQPSLHTNSFPVKTDIWLSFLIRS